MKTSIDQTLQMNGNLKNKPQDLSEIFKQWINMLDISEELWCLYEGNK